MGALMIHMTPLNRSHILCLLLLLAFCSELHSLRLNHVIRHQSFSSSTKMSPSTFQLSMSTKATSSVATNSAEADLSLAPSSVINGATVLKCDKITKSFTGTPQFDEVSFTLGKGQRVGLIDINGAGKSTFLKCLARVDAPDAGSVEVMSNANVVFVEQDPKRDESLVYEVLFGESTPRGAAARKYMAAGDPAEKDPDNALLSAIESMNDGDAWEYQEKGVAFAEKLNIVAADMYRRMGSLSGGQKKRVALAAALLLEPDVLLLDEPTNHLDIDALDWLAEYLRPGGSRDNKDMAVLIVTHDRFFLERVCSEIVELDRGSIFRYPCNYGKYLELKAARLAAEDAETERARTKLRRESEWMARQPKARQAKSRARENAFYELVDKAKGRSPDSKALELATPEEKAKQKRLGGVVAKFRNAGFTLKNEETGDTLRLLQDFTYDFRQRDRIGIVGPNGVGKSTFLKVLTGRLPLESGSVEVGETVRFGWYDQVGLNLTPEQEKMPVLRFVQEECEKADSSERRFSSGENSPKIAVKVEDPSSMGRRNRLAGKEASVEVSVVSGGGQSSAFSERDAMALLSRFQFPSKRWYDRIGQLSGGERRRLQLLQILASKPNVLLLDEPSNDLDLSTLSALEEYLTEVFEGCLVVVSHDNFFVNRVAEHLFVFQGDGIVRDFQGSYAEYLDYRQESLQADKQAEKLASKKKDPAVPSPATATVTASVTSTSTSSKQNIQSTSKSTSSNKQSSTSSTTSGSSEKSSSKAAHTNGRELTYNERKDMNKLEKDVQKLQQQVVALEAKLLEESNKKSGFSVLNDITTDINKLKEQIETKETKWLEYAEIAGNI